VADVLLYLVMYLMCEEFEHFELAEADAHHPHMNSLIHSLTHYLILPELK
jgi:hypothetical protein